LCGPIIGADAAGVLSVNLALIISVLSALLQANQPFIVTIPAVEGLVLSRESRITRRSANILDLVQEIFLLLVEFRNFVAENLVNLRGDSHDATIYNPSVTNAGIDANKSDRGR